MIKTIKKIKFIFIAVALCGLIIFTFSAATVVNAQSAASGVGPKDSDYDGLTDEAEASIYQTDPLDIDTDKDGYLDSAEVLSGTDPLDPLDPAGRLSAPVNTDAPSSLPWYITRAAALTSFILMFFIIVLGEGMTTAYIYRLINPVKAWLIHKYLGIALMLSLLVHVVSLLFDRYMGFAFSDIFIPFLSDFQPLYLSLGIIGFYLLIAIILSSVATRERFRFFWRNIHYFTYLLFSFSFIHGVFIGTDSKYLPMQIVYWFCGLVFSGLIFYRLFIFRAGRKIDSRSGSKIKI